MYETTITLKIVSQDPFTGADFKEAWEHPYADLYTIADELCNSHRMHVVTQEPSRKIPVHEAARWLRENNMDYGILDMPEEEAKKYALMPGDVVTVIYKPDDPINGIRWPNKTLKRVGYLQFGGYSPGEDSRRQPDVIMMEATDGGELNPFVRDVQIVKLKEHSNREKLIGGENETVEEQAKKEIR